MTGKPTGFIDPPGPFADAAVWRAFLDELRLLPQSDDIEAAIAEGERQLGEVEKREAP